MRLSFPSLLACSLSITVLTFIFYLMLKKNFILSRLGIISVYIFSILIIIRGYLPFDFYALRLTKTYTSRKVIPLIQEAIIHRITFDSQITISILGILLFIWISTGCFLCIRKIFGYVFYSRKFKKFTPTSSPRIKRIYHSACCVVFPNRDIHCKIAVAE